MLLQLHTGFNDLLHHMNGTSTGRKPPSSGSQQQRVQPTNHIDLCASPTIGAQPNHIPPSASKGILAPKHLHSQPPHAGPQPIRSKACCPIQCAATAMMAAARNQEGVHRTSLTPGNISLAHVLETLSNTYYQQSDIDATNPAHLPGLAARAASSMPGLSKCKADVARCLRVVAGTCTREDFLLLQHPSSCLPAIVRMVERAMAWVLELEVSLKLRIVDNHRKVKAKATIIGLSKRILAIERLQPNRQAPIPANAETWEPLFL